MLQKLMTKRYECISPFGSFTVGQIIEPLKQHEKLFASKPEIFHELKWYEKRNINEHWSTEEKYFEPIIEIPKTLEIKENIPIEKPVVQNVVKHHFRETGGYHKKDKIIECYSDGSQSKPRFKETDRNDKIALFRIHFKAYKKPQNKN